MDMFLSFIQCIVDAMDRLLDTWTQAWPYCSGPKLKDLATVTVTSDEYWLIEQTEICMGQIASLRLDYSFHIRCAAAGKL